MTAPVWLEPDFLFPDWTTNSDFMVVTPITSGPVNGDGLPTAFSEIANFDLFVRIDYEMLDSVTGIEQGAVPASAGGPGGSITSNRYILNQTYTITNISGETITELKAFQFLHGLESQAALYDDRAYGGAYGAYRYDIFEIGTSIFGEIELEDVVAFHSDIAPTAWEVGYYGSELAGDDHVTGKPSVGAHLSVEADALSGVDLFMPQDLWISGAQRYDLAAVLLADDSISFDVLLSISTEIVPEPCTLFVLGLGSLAVLRRKRC